MWREIVEGERVDDYRTQKTFYRIIIFADRFIVQTVHFTDLGKRNQRIKAQNMVFGVGR